MMMKKPLVFLFCGSLLLCVCAPLWGQEQTPSPQPSNSTTPSKPPKEPPPTLPGDGVYGPVQIDPEIWQYRSSEWKDFDVLSGQNAPSRSPDSRSLGGSARQLDQNRERAEGERSEPQRTERSTPHR